MVVTVAVQLAFAVAPLALAVACGRHAFRQTQMTEPNYVRLAMLAGATMMLGGLSIRLFGAVDFSVFDEGSITWG